MDLNWGWLVVGKWKGAPIRLHWSIPLAALLLGGFHFVPVFWVGFFGLVLLHELGHATVVRWFKLRLHSVDVHGLGGLCTWSGNADPVQRAQIAWGGVWAQMVVLALALFFIAVFGWAETSWTSQLQHVALRANLWLIALNLLPIPPLDGSEAWKLFPLLKQRRAKQAQKQARARQRSKDDEVYEEMSRLQQLDAVNRPDDDLLDDVWDQVKKK